MPFDAQESVQVVGAELSLQELFRRHTHGSTIDGRSYGGSAAKATGDGDNWGEQVTDEAGTDTAKLRPVLRGLIAAGAVTNSDKGRRPREAVRGGMGNGGKDLGAPVNSGGMNGASSTLPPELRDSVLARIRSVPITCTLEMEVLSLDEGACRVRVPRKRIYDGVYETFHGGLLMTIADSAACLAILTKVGAQVSLATTDMNIRFLAPCRGDVTGTAKIIKCGRTLCPVSIDLHDDSGVHVAVAQVTYMLLDRE